ncbi:type V CRISPR-associated protein C2c8 [Nostoc sp.]
MKTLEFKLYPTQVQSQTIDLWLEQLKWIWNRGLEIRLEAQQRRWREKCESVVGRNAHRPLPDSLKLKWKKGKFVSCGVRITKAGHKYCEIRTCRNIENPKKFAQCEFFRSDNIPAWLQDVPTKFKSGVNDALDKAWKTYTDPKHPGRRPRFKGKNEKLKSLLNRNAGGKSKELKPERISGGDNGYVCFPKLGKLYVKGLFKRFVGDEYGSARILKEPSGYYLQVCVDVSEVKLKASDRAVGIDPGLKAVITTDAGREVTPPKLYRQAQAKLRRLQRKLARQQKDSSGSKKTKQLIARLHEKIRRSRNAFNHKLSTKIVHEYGAIAMEDLQIKNLTRKPKAKQREDGNGYEQNGAKRKAGLNKSFADSALGDLISKIESKSKIAGREFVKVPAHYTTIDCSQCGEKIKKSLSIRTHHCTCGYVAGRDENAAQNILLKGRKAFERVYRAWAWSMPLKEGETPSMQVEAVKTAPEAEYASRSRGLGNVNSPAAPQTPSNIDATMVSFISTLSPTRAPSTASLSDELSLLPNTTSAFSSGESFIQLTLWDWAAEIEDEG